MSIDPVPPSLADLLAGCLRNQRRSQELLYNQFYRYSMSICLRYTQTREEAVEILNDGFFKVFTKLDQYDTQKPFKAWLRQILINTALNHYHKAVQHYYHDDVDQIADYIPSTSADAHSQLAYEDLLQLISQLPPAYRMVFNLYVIDGFNHEEIAAQLGISVGTSKSNLARARENLRVMLQKKTTDEYTRVAR